MKKLLFLILLLPVIIFGHPHVFANVLLDIKVVDDKIDSTKISWVFDDMTSQMLLMDYDKDKDGKFSKEESLRFKTDTFDKLKEYGYYTHIKIDGKKIDIEKYIDDFFLIFVDNRFIVNYKVTLKDFPQKTSVKFGMWDEAYYSSFDTEEKSINFSGKNLKYSIDDIHEDIYIGVEVNIKL